MSKDDGNRAREENGYDEVRALARRHGAAAIDGLLDLGTKANSEAVKLAALRELLDRGFGRVPAASGPGDSTTFCYLIVDDGYDA